MSVRPNLLWRCGTYLTFLGLSLGAIAADAADVTDATQTLAPAHLINNVSMAVRQRLDAGAAAQALSRAEVIDIVDSLVLPNVELARMTASAMGRHWRRATPVQQLRLQEEFLRLVVHTYAGALSQIGDQSITVLPAWGEPEDVWAVVKTEVRGGRQPIRIDYRLVKTPEGWKIFDFSVMGIWLTLNYRSSFAHVIATDGIDGLILKLAEKNRVNGE